MSDTYAEYYGAVFPTTSQVAAGVAFGPAGGLVGTLDTSTESLDERIQTLEDLLDSGATSVVQDGQSVTFDREGARKRLRELKAKKAAEDGATSARPPLFSVNMNF